MNLPLMSWFQWLVILLVLGLVGVLAYVNLIGNPRVVRELTANPQGERADVVMLLRLPNGRVLPVNYRREGNQVFVGADGPWWRALGRNSVPVTVTIRGETLSGRARVVFAIPTTSARCSSACGLTRRGGCSPGWMRTWWSSSSTSSPW